ncbi:hypothetical protein D3C74_55610 [compost metagenome]
MKWGTPGMPSNRSFFNRGMFRQNLRQHGWISILYLLALIFVLPIQLVLAVNWDEKFRRDPLDNLFVVQDALQALILVVFPVITGVFITRYLQSKAAADLYHSLPLRRSHILANQLLCGSLIVLVPVWLTTGIMTLMTGNEQLSYLFESADVWYWGITASMVSLFLLVFTVFVGMCVGQSIFQTVVVYILLLLPAILVELMGLYLRKFIFGYPDSSLLGIAIEKLSPLVTVFTAYHLPLTRIDLLVYIGLCAVFVALSFLLYQRRHIEKASQAVVFAYFHPVFKAGVILCAMMLAGYYFSEQSRGSLPWTLFGYVLGAVLGYTAAEMMLRKSWQIWGRKMLVESAVYTAVIGLLLYIPVSPWTGYESRIPAASTVDGVFFGEYLYPYNQGSKDNKDIPYVQNEEYAAAVLSLHREIVTSRPDERRITGRESRPVIISYHLKNGKTMLRTYTVPEQQLREQLKTVMEMPDYKQERYRLQQLEVLPDRVTIESPDSYNKYTVVTGRDKIHEMMQVLTEEYHAMDYEVMIDNVQPRANIELLWQGQGKQDEDQNKITLQWKPSFSKLSAWMEEHGVAKEIALQPKDIRDIQILKYTSESAEAMSQQWLPPYELFKQSNPVSLMEARDDAMMQYILDHRRSYDPADPRTAYVLRMLVQNTENFYVLFAEDVTPELTAFLER